ncbi:hypothetical protein [Leucobacter massiliensis]|uniref:Uncharacterized protein n=1 Tax=Leucobacter massiliensis TaxID=1686285 RepID=A0A2S9QMY0_9MICO|nr:hypothetical protein [Leucobacter massiliensis]PRI10949.1 hypothetical protein B4915_08680 [Leucobacter massiliensis]
MVLKYTSKRPDEELDGIQSLEDHFKGPQPSDVLAVVVVSGHSIVESLADGARTATVRIKQIEPVSGADAQTVRTLLAERYEQRTGNAPLPLEDIAEDADELPSIPWGGDDA